LNLCTQRYTVTPHLIETILTWVKSGEIAIPATRGPSFGMRFRSTLNLENRDSPY